jgi:hypothetical protein
MQYQERERESGEGKEKEGEEEKNAIVFATVHDKREQSADPHQLFSS